jgi:hypothetical protein
MNRQISRVFSLACFVAILCGPAPAAACGWSIFESPMVGGYSGVSQLLLNDAWTVGTTGPSSGTHLTFASHWDGVHWTTVPTQDTGTKDALLSSAMVSSSDVWAVGNFNTGSIVQPLSEHWDGLQWSIIPSPSFPSYATLLEVAPTASNDVWAVGYFQSPTHFHTLVEHWNGASWSIVPSPNIGGSDNFLFDVSVESPTSVWAVGFDTAASGRSHPLVLHWNGANWTIIPDAETGQGILDGVVAVGPNDVWATGQVSKQRVVTLAEHWNGTAWTISPTKNVAGAVGDLLDYVAASGTGDVWAVGTYLTSDNLFHSLVEHFDGTAWRVVATPLTSSTVNWRVDVAALSPQSVWVVGTATGTDGINHGFREHFHC